MADISLHYSSKAPLAGTYTAFANVLQLWRRRAHDRQELAKLDTRSLRELGLTQIWSTAGATTEHLFRYLIAQPMVGRRVVAQLDSEPLRENLE